MIKRIIDISEGPTYLSVENDQLILSRDRATVAAIPCDDVGVLLVDSGSTVYTHAALMRLSENGAVVVLCDSKHLPGALVLPFQNNGLLTARLRTQIAAPLPLRKQLWRQIVQHKIRLQATNLSADSSPARALRALADEVKSGDTSNAEGHAARIYWQALMGAEFRRDPDGLPPNNLLNYGYTVFRAACARAIVAAGLHPAIGLYHSHRNNPFCLADDLVEIFRPRVDRAVVDLMQTGSGLIDKSSKQIILGLFGESVTVAGQGGPLMVQLHRVVTSLVKCFEGEQKNIDLPEYPAQSIPGDAEELEIE